MTDFDNLLQSQPTEHTTATSSRRWGRIDPYLLLLVILLVGAYFRFLNVDWDEGEHLHPDERYMTMVTGAIRSPGPNITSQNPPASCISWGGYFDSYCSPLNPYNHQGYGSYAYGTLPLFSARIFGEWLSGACLDPANPNAVPSQLQRWIAGLFFDDVDGCVGNRFTDYRHIHLLGRMLSALVDLGTLLFTFLIGRRLYGSWVGLLAAALYAFAALPIQQSHFYTVDSFAGFFVTVAGYFAVRGAQKGRWIDFIIAGLTFGFALASKVSVWPFAAVIALAALLYYVHSRSTPEESSSAVPLHANADIPPLSPEQNAAPTRVLDGLMIILLLIFCFLVTAIALLGIWSAVKIAFFFAAALLFMGGLGFYVLRPGAIGAPQHHPRGTSIDAALLRLILAGIFAFLAFRVAQPYAFVGADFDVNQWQAPEHDWLRGNVPEIWYTLNDKLPEPLRALLLPDPRFIGTLGSVNKQLTGEADVPWGHQWTNRLPFVFPWVNMVVWGMGIPLGLIVSAGWGYAAWELWRGKRRMQHFIPWAWATILFFYQGTQWVKSIRYLLSAYPFLILLGAWLLVRLVQTTDRTKSTWRQRLPSIVYPLPLIVTLAATFLWAWGFSRIYAHPVTRNTASRWMIENIPTAATLHFEVNGVEKTQFLRMPATYTYAQDGFPNLSTFVLPEAGVVTGITLTHLGDPEQDAEPEGFKVTLATDANGQTVLAETNRTINLEQSRHPLGDAQYFDLSPTQLRSEQEYYLITQATMGAPARLDTTIIANEYPDDSLPTRVDGRDPFGGLYRGLQSAGDGKTHWDLNEDANKLSQALDWLDEADIIALSSNRGYASIPRLPGRYPLAIAYFRGLFAEELGFELIASFASYPTIGPFQFPDQETPFPAGTPSMIQQQLGSFSIHLPPAEEAFSVYDHPQVFLFRKTADYSRSLVEDVLGSVNLSQVVWMKPTAATLAPTALLHTEPELDTQRAGGTWSDIFDTRDWLNRSPWLGLIVWWALMQVVGLLVFPLLFFVAPGLRDRGWPFAKILGLLLWATLAWFAGSTRLFTFSRPLIFFLLLALAVLGAALAWWQRQELIAWVARERRTLLVSELLFSGLFVLFLLIRYGNPDLWHPVMGGERPMNFAYLNAVIKSTIFPPYDPWFSGGYLNYYYFGYVVVGVPIKLLGILPDIAYNLILPTLFAMTGAGAFSVAFNLVAHAPSRHPSQPSKPRKGYTRYAIYAGLIAALFVVILGNISEISLVVDGFTKLGSDGFEFESTIPGLKPLVVGLRGLVRHVVGGEPMPWRPEWPYWNGSRVIPHPQGEAPPINEFPFFTFLYSDLHAHMLALPITLLALALAVNWATNAEFWQLRGADSSLRWRRWFSALLGLIIAGIVIGSLRPTNYWDYLTYLPLPLLTLSIGYAIHGAGLPATERNLASVRNGVAAVGGRFMVLVSIGYLLFLPYINRFATGYSSVELWKGSKTVLWAYLVVHGLFLFPIITWLLMKSWHSLHSLAGSTGQTWYGRVAVLLLLLVTLFAFVAGYQAALVVLPGGFLASVTLLHRRSGPSERLIALLGGVGLFLTLLVEVVVQSGDISRMNTVFKFYLQAWVLLGIAAAVSTVWIARHFSIPAQVSTTYVDTESGAQAAIPAISATPALAEPPHAALPVHVLSVRTFWQAWRAILIVLVVLAALYPVLATRAKINDRWAHEIGPGLDSLEWMKTVNDVQFGEGAPDGLRFPIRWDYDALMWLRENIQGSPVVAEGAKAQPYRSLRGRVATYTGLPIIVGYPWHQKQQRSFIQTDIVGQRERDVDILFGTSDPWQAQGILDRYDVSLVYVGDLERAHYTAAGIEKFAQMKDLGLLQPIYDNPGVTIYQVVR